MGHCSGGGVQEINDKQVGQTAPKSFSIMLALLVINPLCPDVGNLVISKSCVFENS